MFQSSGNFWCRDFPHLDAHLSRRKLGHDPRLVQVHRREVVAPEDSSNMFLLLLPKQRSHFCVKDGATRVYCLAPYATE